MTITTQAGKTSEDKPPPAKECPTCQTIVAAGFSKCPSCGYEFPPPERQKHDAQASTAGVLSGQVTITEYAVSTIYYAINDKQGAEPGAPRTLRVDYEVGWNRWIKEWVCVEHQGYARAKAEAWWRQRSQVPVPATAENAFQRATHGALAEPSHITVREVAGEKFPRITDARLGPIPEIRQPGADESEPAHIGAWDGDEEIPF